MIDGLRRPPKWSRYNEDADYTQKVREYYESEEYGGPDFFYIQTDYAGHISTYAEEWINHYENEGFYKIKKIQLSPSAESNGDVYYDLYMLPIHLTEEEHIHL